MRIDRGGNVESAIILAIGNGVVEGLILDTNSKYMSQRLSLQVITLYALRLYQIITGMKDRISVALQDADLIIVWRVRSDRG